MFNAERAITDWRRQMAAGGIQSPDILDELETHLREEIRTLSAAGTAEDEAFRLAVSRLGGAESIRAEFEKVAARSGSRWIAHLLRWGRWMLIAAMALFVIVFRERSNVLLIAHTITLTGGYIAAFVAGGLGMAYVCCRALRLVRPPAQEALNLAAIRFLQVSAGLVLAGFVLGIFWNANTRGLFLSGDPRQIGTLCVLAWLGVLCLIWRSRRIEAGTAMLLCVAGNVVVSLAWFGAGVIAHGKGIASYWPLNAVLGLTLLFVAAGASMKLRSLPE